MSNEVKTKEKVNMDPKYIIKLTVTLLLTCMVVAGLLGWVNSITKDKIAAITWEKTVAAMQEVIERRRVLRRHGADRRYDRRCHRSGRHAGCRLSGSVRRSACGLRHQRGGFRLSGHHLHDGGHRHGRRCHRRFHCHQLPRPPVSAPRS